MSDIRKRRLMDRARRSWESHPQQCLDSVERLINAGEGDPELLLLKARALLRLGRPTAAVELWQQLLQADTVKPPLSLEALHCFLQGFDYSAIKQLLPEVVANMPPGEDALVLCIRAAQAIRDSELALQLCERLVEIAPENTTHRCKLGTFYQSFGRMEEAERQFRQALDLDRDYQPGWYFLSQLKKWTTNSKLRQELESFLERQTPGEDTSAAHFALAKVAEDQEAFDLAFQHLESGSRQIRGRSGYQPVADRQMFQNLRSWYVDSDGHTTPGDDQQGPLFILGMPRTGSTLTDRILSSHSEISSVGELMCFRRAVEELCDGQGQTDFFASFFASAPQTLPYREIGERYLEMLAPLTGSQRFVIDKMPMNYVFVGLIARALPQARFIHTLRNPMDTCFSNYKQMFGEGYYGYSYDLQDLAEHYKLYRELMAFWHQQLPGRIYDLEYENLVADPEKQVRDLLEWLDLDWQQNCLQFPNSTTAVNTASVSQVRQPIYSGSVEKWRRFATHLAPLRHQLKH